MTALASSQRVMTLSAPTDLDRERGPRATKAINHEPARPARPQEGLRQAAHAQSVLMVDLASSDGRSWWAVGVGDTLAEALAFAQDSCPTDATWQPISWKDLYGN